MTTTSHPGQEPTPTAWVAAQDLKPGDQVLTDTGAFDYKVHGAETAQARVQVADTQGGTHTYNDTDVLPVRPS